MQGGSTLKQRLKGVRGHQALERLHRLHLFLFLRLSLPPPPLPPFVFWAIATFFFPIEPFAQFWQNALISQLIIIKIRKKLSHLPALLSTICANPIILHNDTEECFEISSPHSYTSNKSSLLLLRLLFLGGRVDGQFFPVCLFPF